MYVLVWYTATIPPAPTGAKISSCFLFGGFVVIGDVVLILRMINEFPWIFTGKIGFVIIRRVGGLRGPHLNRHRSVSCFDSRTFARALTKKRMRLGRRSKRTLATLWWHDIDEVEYSEAKGRKYVSEIRSKFTLKTTFTAMLTMQSKNTNRCRLVYN